MGRVPALKGVLVDSGRKAPNTVVSLRKELTTGESMEPRGSSVL